MPIFEKDDYEAAKILADFVPDRVLDAHMHLNSPRLIEKMPPMGPPPKRWVSVEEYLADTAPLFGNKKAVRLNILPPVTDNAAYLDRTAERSYTAELLDAHPEHVAEVCVLPGDDEDALRAQLVHPRVVGFKPYHVFLHRPDSWDADIGEMLPECAWALADRLGLCITLHMVKNRALADPANMAYIKTMAKKYPNAVLILAHAARGFAAWTTVETVGELAGYDNVWFDIAAVCESPAIFQVLHKTGTKRCMWGTDYPVAAHQGKCISLADGFYWLYEEERAHFKPMPYMRSSWSVFTENLMATRQACLMADLNEDAVEDLFYNNAMRLFRPDDRK